MQLSTWFFCSTALAGAGDHRSPAPAELVSPRGPSRDEDKVQPYL